MTYLVAFIVCFIAGIGAGLGTGFAGMSAAAVISPMLITFLGMDPYMAVGIALASDVLASAISAYTYGKSGNLDIKNGAVMMASVLCFTLVGSYVASLVPGTTMGGFSTFMTLLLGVKFIVRPVMTTKSAMNAVSAQKRFSVAGSALFANLAAMRAQSSVLSTQQIRQNRSGTPPIAKWLTEPVKAVNAMMKTLVPTAVFSS